MKNLSFKSITAALLLFGITSGTFGVVPASANITESCYEQNCTVWFSHSGQIQIWQPPINARNMTFQVSGGQGGKSGGQGGRVTGSFSQIPDTLYVAVAGAGVIGSSAAGGFNGGGAAGAGSNNEGSGGGSSDIRLGNNVESRIVVAGGGGGRGAGITPTANPGGGLIAMAGKDGQGLGGGGGSQDSGGFGGAANGTGSSGTAGALQVGGTGGSSSLYGGGGGGGGYFGGGGGGSDTDSCCSDAGAGGGGSSYADSFYTENVVHTPGVKSGHGLVMIEYQLVPLFQFMGTQTQLTNQSSIDFQIELSDPFANFSASHIFITGDSDICQPGNLVGSGSSYTYTLIDCTEGQVGISIPENSISEPRYSGPEQTQLSPMVLIDHTAPIVAEIMAESQELIIPISEPVAAPVNENFTFTSSSDTCQVLSLSASTSQTWLATLIGCEATSYSFAILANSVSDLAGNQGPANDITFAVSIPLPEPMTPPQADLSQTPVAPAPNMTTTSTTSPSEPVAPSNLESAPIEDSLVTEKSSPRSQAAQSVIEASATTGAGNFSMGWTVGFAIAGLLLLSIGLSLRRRGVSELLVN